jgi:hypothetical protein
LYDSLVISNQIELLGGGVVSANPQCAGAMFQLQPRADPGAPQPTADFVASLLLDGERPYGRRASNRTITLPIWITAPDRHILGAAREQLQQAVDQDFWTLTWTRDPSAGNPGGTALAMLLDCFRAQPTVSTFNTMMEKQLCGMQIVLTIPALPYGRSDTQVQVAFAAPTPASPPAPPPPVTLDTYAAISSSQCSQSTQCAVGPFTACWDPDSFGDPGGQVTPLIYPATFTAPVNLAGMTSLQWYLGLGSRYYSSLEYSGKLSGVGLFVTLTDITGNTLSFSRSNLQLPSSPSAQVPAFSRVSVPIPQGSPAFNYGAVAGYSLQVTNRQYPNPRLSWVTCYLDNLTALPSSQTVYPAVRGSLVTIYGMTGTARAAASLSFQAPPTAGTPTLITATGPGTYTPLTGTAWLKVECTAGAGAGATMTVAGQGGGGEGAGYAAEYVFPCTVGVPIPFSVGTGGTPGATPVNGQSTIFGPGPGSTLAVVASGGISALQNSAAGASGQAVSGNSVQFPGGSGRTASGGLGGGGGSSGGSSAAGNAPAGSGSQVLTGSSNWLCPAGVFLITAVLTGAGAGGSSGSSNFNGEGGGGGECTTYQAVTVPGTNYPYSTGAGGAGGLGSGGGGHAGNNGGNTTFTFGSLVMTANGGTGGYGSAGPFITAPGGQGAGAPVDFPGGHGGSSYPYTGGGGSSAGPAAPGNPGNGYGNPGIAPPGGGNGGAGSGAANGAGQAGVFPGGGGGGSYNAGYAGGAGAAGTITITYPATTGAPTSSGGAAVAGGGAGGAGGAAAGSAGSAGAAPGGAGGGGNSSGAAQAGGAGAAGQIKITPYASAPFKNLIVHRPPLGSLKTFQPLVSIGAGSDAPDGTHEYRMPQPLTGVNADFGGTYTIYLIAASLSGTAARTITVTVNQYEYAGGPKYASVTLPVTITPSQISNGVITAGVLTLPVKAVAPDNTSGYYTVTPFDSNSADRLYDCIFLDTMGQTCVINEPATGYLSYYLDAPDPNLSLGRVLGSQGGRAEAISVMDNAILSGGPMILEPSEADNQLFAYSADGLAPAIALSYFPAWFFDRYR